MKTVLLLLCTMLILTQSASFAQLPGDSKDDIPGRETEVSRRKTAVTLNYCRAALHRIRKAGSKKVLFEEQQRILNNIDLNQIDDPEVISLYRSTTSMGGITTGPVRRWFSSA